MGIYSRRSKTTFVDHFFSGLQKFFKLALLLTRSLTILGTAGVWTNIRSLVLIIVKIVTSN